MSSSEAACKRCEEEIVHGEEHTCFHNANIKLLEDSDYEEPEQISLVRCQSCGELIVESEKAHTCRPCITCYKPSERLVKIGGSEVRCHACDALYTDCSGCGTEIERKEGIMCQECQDEQPRHKKQKVVEEADFTPVSAACADCGGTPLTLVKIEGKEEMVCIEPCYAKRRVSKCMI